MILSVPASPPVSATCSQLESLAVLRSITLSHPVGDILCRIILLGGVVLCLVEVPQLPPPLPTGTPPPGVTTKKKSTDTAKCPLGTQSPWLG